MTLSIRARVLPIASAAVMTATLAACGADGGPGTGTPAPASPAAGATVAPSPSPTDAPTPDAQSTVAIPPLKGAHNELDAMFATDMIPHHRQAVEMAQLARTRASDPRITAIARRIEQSQAAEVTLMAGWLKAWGKPVPPPDKLHSAHGPGMMTHAEMEDLKAATGAEFDRLFADMMIRHHEGALQMADTTKDRGQNLSVHALATNVLITQAAEVAELTLILQTL